MKSMFDVAPRFVMLSFPKLKNSIVCWDFVLVYVSTRSSSGFCLRSDLTVGDSKDAFAVG